MQNPQVMNAKSERGTSSLNGDHAGEFGHFVQFYETDTFLIDSLREFIGTGLTKGNAVIATAAHRERLEERLRTDGLDLDAARSQEAYSAFDAGETLAQFMAGGMSDEARFAKVIGDIITRAAEGGRPVRLFGEMVALLWSEGNHAAAIRLEELWNELREIHPFALCCAYPMPDFAGLEQGTEFIEICARHGRVIPDEHYIRLENPDDRLLAIALLQQKASSLEAEIAERKRAEERNRAAESRYRQLFEASSDGILLVDPESGNIIDANPAMIALPGANREQLLAQKVWEIGLFRDQEAFQEAVRDLREHRAVRYESMPLHTKDGQRLFVELVGNLYRANGHHVIQWNVRDITERKQHELALRESEERLAAYVNSSIVGVAVLTPAAQFLQVNDAFCNIVGYSREELASMDCAGLTHPDDVAPMQEHLDALLSGRVPAFVIEKRYQRKDGGLIWVQNNVSLTRDAAGEPVHLVALCQDITERKRSEALLTIQKQVLELIASGAALPDVLVALVRGIEEQSDGMLGSILVRDPVKERFHIGIGPSLPGSYIGVLATAPISPPYLGSCGRAANLGEEVVTFDIASDLRWADEWRELALSHGLHSCYSAPILASDGRLLGSFAMYYREPHDPKPADMQLVKMVTHLAGIAIERTWAEEQLKEDVRIIEKLHTIGLTLTAKLDLKALVQTVTDVGTAVTHAEFGSFFYNVLDDQGESYMLYTLSGANPEEFSSLPMPRTTPLFLPTFEGSAVIRLDDVMEDPRAGPNPPYNGMPPGHLPVRSYLAVPVISRSGEVLGGLFFGHSEPGVFAEQDERLAVGIAGQAAIAIDNGRLYEEAQRAIRVRDEFLSMASHELKTPLTTLKGVTHLLSRHLSQSNLDHVRLVGYAGRLQGQLERLEQLVNDLLDASRIQRGRLELRPEPCDLREIAWDVLLRCQEAAERNDRHRLTISAPDPVRAVVDPDRIDQVLSNLVTNALKYSPDGGVIELAVARQDGHAVITVSDEGIGISPEDQARLFQPFARSDSVRGNVSGSGLGLHISREIVDQHGGQIAVESEVGLGSTFTVRLPCDGRAGSVAQPRSTE